MAYRSTDELDVSQAAWQSPNAEPEPLAVDSGRSKFVLPYIPPPDSDDPVEPAVSIPKPGRLLQVRPERSVEPQPTSERFRLPYIEPPPGIEPEPAEKPITQRRGLGTWTADTLTHAAIGVSEALHSIAGSFLSAASFGKVDFALPKTVVGAARQAIGVGTLATPAGLYNLARMTRGRTGPQTATELEGLARGHMDEIRKLEELRENLGGLKFAGTVTHALAGLLPYVVAGPAAPVVIAHQVFGSTWLASKDAYRAKFPDLSDDEIEAKAFVPSVMSAIGAGLIWHFIPKLGKDAKGSDLLKYLTALKDKLSTPKEVVIKLLKHMGITATAAGADILQQEIIAKASYAPELTLPEIFGHALTGGAGMGALTGFLGLPRLGTTAYRHLRRPQNEREFRELTRKIADDAIAKEKERQVTNAPPEVEKQEGVPGERPGIVPQQPPKAEGQAPVPPADIADRVRSAEAGVVEKPKPNPAAAAFQSLTVEQLEQLADFADLEVVRRQRGKQKVSRSSLQLAPFGKGLGVFDLNQLEAGFDDPAGVAFAARETIKSRTAKTAEPAAQAPSLSWEQFTARRSAEVWPKLERARREREALGDDPKWAEDIRELDRQIAEFEDQLSVVSMRRDWAAGKTPAEEPAQPAAPGPGVEVYQTRTALSGRTLKIEEYKETDPSQFGVHENWKLGADPKTGVVPSKQIKQEFDPGQYQPILVWEDKSGKKWVFSGRHRYDAWKRTGKGQPIRVKLFRESDGWTREEVDLRDIIDNIRTGGVSEYDFGNFFRKRVPNLTREQAEQEDLLRDEAARTAFTIARDGSQAVFDAWMVTGKRQAYPKPGDPRRGLEGQPAISSEQAVLISEKAPKDEGVQGVGLAAAIRGDSNPMVRRQMEAALVDVGKQGDRQPEQGDWLKNTDYQETWRKRADYVERQISKLRGMIFNRRAAEGWEKKEAITLTEQQKTEIAELNNLKAQLARWERWATEPELVKEVEANATPKVQITIEAARAQADAVAADLAAVTKELDAAREAARLGKGRKLKSEVNQLEKAYKAVKADDAAYKKWLASDPSKTGEPAPERRYKRGGGELKEEPPVYGTKTPEQQIKNAVDDMRDRKSWTQAELPPGEIAKADLTNLQQTAAAMNDQGFRAFAQRVHKDLFDGWDYLKGHLAKAWNVFGDISPGEAARVLKQVGEGTAPPVAAKGGRRMPPRPPSPTDKWYKSLTPQQQDAYNKLMAVVAEWFPKQYPEDSRKPRKRPMHLTDQYIGVRIWAKRAAMAGYDNWAALPTDWVESQTQAVVDLHNSQLAKGEKPLSLKRAKRYGGWASNIITYSKEGKVSEVAIKRGIGRLAKATQRHDYIAETGENSIERLLSWEKLPKTDEGWLIRAFLELAYGSGGRMEEVRELKAGQLDFAKGIMEAVFISKIGNTEDLMLTPASAWVTEVHYLAARRRLINKWVNEALAKIPPENRPTVEEVNKLKATDVLFPDPKDIPKVLADIAKGKPRDVKPMDAPQMRQRAQKYAAEMGVKLTDAESKFTPQALRGSVQKHLAFGAAGLGEERVKLLVPHELDVSDKYYLNKNDPSVRDAWRDLYGIDFQKTAHNSRFVRLHPEYRPEMREVNLVDVGYKGGRVVLKMSPARYLELEASEAGRRKLDELKEEAWIRQTTGQIRKFGALPTEERRSPVVDALMREGVSFEDASALVNGTKTVKDVVAGNFKVRPSQIPIPGGKGPIGHAEAWMEGYNQAIERLTDILERPPAVTERRYENVNDLLAALDNPDLPVTPEARATLRAIITSKMAEAMPALKVAITNWIETGDPRRSLSGEYVPGEDVVRLAHWVRSATPVEEFLHRVFAFLKEEDKAFVGLERKRAIAEEIAKRAEPKDKKEEAELALLKELQTKDFTTDEWLDQDRPESLYKFSNDTEYFHFLMQRRATAYFTKPETQGFVARLREVFKDLWETVKRFVGLSAKEDDLWHSLATGTYDYDAKASQRWGLGRPRQGALNLSEEELAKLTPERRKELESLEPTSEAAEVMVEAVGATKAIISIIDPLIKLREDAQAILDKELLVKASFKKVVGKTEGYLWQILNAVVDGIKKSPDQFWDDRTNYPKGPMDPNLGAYATRLEIDVDAIALNQARELAGGQMEAIVPAVQAEIGHERMSRRNLAARQKLDEWNQALQNLGPGAELPGIKEQIEPEITRLTEQLARDLKREEINAEGKTISERGEELYNFERDRPENEAKAASLRFELVQTALIGMKSAAKEWEDTLKLYGQKILDFREGAAAMGAMTPEGRLEGDVSSLLQVQTMQRMAVQVMAAFETLDSQYAAFKNFKLKEYIDISKRVKRASEKIAEKAGGLNNAETLLLEIINLRNGDKGYLGTTRGQLETEYLKESSGMILTFIERLRAKYPENGAELVLMRLLNRTPAFSMSRTVERFEGSDRIGRLRAELGASEKIIIEGQARLAEMRNERDAGRPIDENEREILADRVFYFTLVADVLRGGTATAEALSRIIIALQDSKPLADASLVIARMGAKLNATDPIRRLVQASKLLDVTELNTKRDELKLELDKERLKESVDQGKLDYWRGKIAELDEQIEAQRAEAFSILDALDTEAKRKSKNDSLAIKFAEREVAQARIDLKALQYADELFDSFATREVQVTVPPEPVAGPRQPGDVTPPAIYPRTIRTREPNPEYYKVYNAAASIVGGEWRPILGNGIGNSPNGDSVFYMGYDQSVPDGTGKLVRFQQKLVVYRANESPVLDETNFKRIAEYMEYARKFTEAVSESLQRGDENLAVDIRIYRGLLRMLDEHYGRHMDRTILSFVDKKAGLAVEQKILYYAIFHSHLTVLRQGSGLAARQSQGYANDYFNTKRLAEKVHHKHKLAITRKRGAALESHKHEFGRTPSIEEYLEIWVELASEGRRPGAETEAEILQEGLYLPRTGMIVTKEDLAFIDENRSYYEDLRNQVTEYRQYQRAPGEGVERVRRGTGIQMVSYVGDEMRVDVRASVGFSRRGLPMHLSPRGTGKVAAFGAAVLRAAKREKEGELEQRLDANTDLTLNSENLVVRFLNGEAGKIVRSLIGDAGRSWSALDYGTNSMNGRRMVAALQSVYKKVRAERNAGLIRSLDDAVSQTTIQFRDLFPGEPITRGEVADYIVGLVGQYGRLALSIRPEAGKVQQNISAGGISLKSEFTTPAAKFSTFSDWYDYGVLTDVDLVLTTARATHETAMNYAESLARWQTALSAEIDHAAAEGGKSWHYASHNEAVRVQKLISKLIVEFNKSYIDPLDPDVARRGNLLFNATKTSLLANPPVPLRNFTLGAVMVWMKMRALDRFHEGLAALRVFRHVAEITARIPVHMVFSPTHAPGRKMLALFRSGPVKRMLPAIVHNNAEKMIQSMIDANLGLETHGFSHRDSYFDEIKTIWSRTMQFERKHDAEAANKSKLRWSAIYVWRGAKNVVRTMQATWRLVGTEAADLHINAVSNGYYGVIDRGLREVALKYYDRIRASTGGRELEYDPTNPIFTVLPGELSNRPTFAGKQRNLAEWHDFLVGTDVDLGKTLWDYGKAYESQQLKLNEVKQQIEAELAAGRVVPNELINKRDALRIEPELFNRVQSANVRAAIIRDFNAADAFNQPTAITNNRLFRTLATFQAWSSRFFIDFLRQFVGAKSQTAVSRLLQAVPLAFAYGLVAAVLGMTGATLVDQYKRHVQGQSKRMLTALDKEFWTDWHNAWEALHISVLSTMPWIGDLALYVKNTIANNRGYEPTGRILVFGIINSVLNTIRGVWNLRHDPDNILNPARDFILQYAAFGREISRLANTQGYSSMQQRSAESIIRFRAKVLGLAGDSQPSAVVRRGPVYSATSGYREDMYVAMVKRNADALHGTYQKLVAYYADQGAEKPIANAVRDVRYMNPIVRAFGNRKPTVDEYRFVYDGLTSDQKEDVDAAIANWNWAANLLNISFSPFATAPATSTGAALGIGAGVVGAVGVSRSGGPRLRGVSGASAGGVRRLSLRSLRPGGSSFNVRPSLRRSRLHLGRPRPLRVRRPRRRRLRYRVPTGSIV